VVHLPTFVPVEADPEKFPIMSLVQQKRDFGITAAIVTAIAVSVASAVTAGIAMANQVNTADTISQIAEKKHLRHCLPCKRQILISPQD
jgi:hypothetical protein